jgi:mono/diheme cytochrome c family protein
MVTRTMIRTVCVAAGFGLLGWTPLSADEPVRFGRDVLPILSANCYSCHGPDEAERKANLRLDVESDAKQAHDTGVPVVPGQLEESTLIERILSDDPATQMPPPDSHKTLKPEQIATLKRWVTEGAKWGRHWSFEAVERPRTESPAIDALVDAQLEKLRIAKGSIASPHALARRVSLDLIGLPPTVAQADAFAADPSETAWEKLVDELLARPEFGEHWARVWMDLARYADTKGYEKDLGRTMWPYRDWLVRAINADMPLDQMTIEQLAGDLLPNATPDQIVATAFHRHTMSNDEGGTDDEEFRTVAVKDRVDTTMQVWMGLTAGCAKCHSHKYDPLAQSEYYGLYAIFNQTQDADRYDDFPLYEVASPEQIERRLALEARLTEARAKLDAAKKADAERGEQNWRAPTMVGGVSEGGATLTAGPDVSIVVSGKSPAEDVYTVTLTLAAGRHTALRLQALSRLDGQPPGGGRNPRDPNFVLSELEVELLEGEKSRRLTLSDPRADYEQPGWPVKNALDGDKKTGWAVSPHQTSDHVALFKLAEPLELSKSTMLRLVMRQHYGDALVLRRFRWTTSGEDPKSLPLDGSSDETRKLAEALAAVEKEQKEFVAALPKIPVMRAVDTKAARVTKIHKRGNFLDPGDEVKPGLPSAFAFGPAVESREPAAVDRLAFAKWLTHADNPLTPRVWANRVWARLFGIGLVETEEDFGALGSGPTHPELLDWLATEYRDNGWSLKKLLKTIVMSRAYRRNSDTTAEQRELDPRNAWLSRGSRYRLSGEVLRDQTLAVAGLLSLKKGGPPVMPPQPDGLWRSTYNGLKWVNAEGEDRFRRALYTYLKRTTPYPSMITFDAGSGEVCQIRRIRTNTPLQALVTLNDPVYLEAAGGFARRMLTEGGSELSVVIERGLRLALVRPVRKGETEPLARLRADALAEFGANPASSAELVKASRAKPPEGLSEPEFAAWIVVANTILNLDEFLTRN